MSPDDVDNKCLKYNFAFFFVINYLFNLNIGTEALQVGTIAINSLLKTFHFYIVFAQIVCNLFVFANH